MKKNYRAVVVDDEERARQNLRNVLKQHPDIVVEAEAGDVPGALDAVRSLQPDLIFLDIKMPGQDGFDLLEALAGEQLKDAEIIFLTAYDEFAIRAIKCAAFDYLLKPVDPELLAETLDRFRASSHAELPQRIQALEAQWPRLASKLRFSTQTGFAWFNPEQILYIEAEGSYSTIYNSDGGHVLVCRNLKAIEDQLEGMGFIRVHKSFLINAGFLVSFDKARRIVKLASANARHEVPVSFRMMRNLSL